MTRGTKGFTLIELIMVIAILGILSAFALPRFADLSGDAKRAALEGARAAVISASSISHSKALAANLAESAVIPLDGANISSAFRYPDATATGIQDAAQISSNDFDVSFDGSSTPPVMTVRAKGASAGSCQFTYTEAADANTPPVISIIANSGNC